MEIKKKFTKETIHTVIFSNCPACINILIENEVDGEVPHSKGRNVYLVPFFNLFYCLGYFPIKLYFNKEKDKYFIKTHRVQKVICLISQIYTLSFLTYYTSTVMAKILSEEASSGGKAIQIFEAASNAGLTATSAFFIHNSWRRSHLILEVIERTRVTSLKNRKLRIICAIAYGCSSLIVIVFGIFESFLKIQQSSLLKQGGSSANLSFSSEESVFSQSTGKQVDVMGQETLFDNFGIVDESDMNDGFGISVGKVLILTAMFTYVLLYYSVCQALFILLMLTMKQTGNEFNKRLKVDGYQDDENGSGLSKGIELYRELKKTAELVKKVFGNSMTGYYVCTVAYLAVAPHILLGNQGNFERIVTVYSAFSFLLWIVAAEFHYQTRNSVLEWTEYHFEREDITTDNRLKLFAISHDISSTEATSIAVANKFFVVTYKHLCSVIMDMIYNMLGLIVTYGIIVFQLHQGQVEATKNANKLTE